MQPDQSLNQAIDELIEETYKADEPGAAVIVVKEGATVYRRGRGMANLELGVPIQPDMVFRIASLTKQFTAVAVLMLAEQGKLAVEFTILGNGQLQRLRLIRSSGSLLLDDEALRAIKAAAPFPPIPPWIKPNPLPISATMEYRDSRLDYRLMR